jgi:DNA-binding MarR family transcriptional regulator
LWDKDGVTQQEIASATYHDKPSVTRLLDNMEKNGLVVRVASKNDKRSNLVYLTKKGREFKMALSPISLSVMNKAISGLSKDEVETAEYLFRKVFCNLK